MIELNETKVHDTEALRRFVERRKDMAFLIALDDMGSGHSNRSRISELRPHIIKLDRSPVDGVDHTVFRQETMKSLVLLGQSIGSLVRADGVETQAELDTSAALGAELFHGFHFARSRPPDDLHLGALLAVDALRSRRQSSLPAGDEGC